MVTIIIIIIINIRLVDSERTVAMVLVDGGVSSLHIH